MVAWGELEPLFMRGTALEELSLEEGERSVHVSYQPPQEFKGRIPDWVGEIRQALEREDTVLFVAGSRGRAERTVELLRDYDVRASWAGHADEQRAAGAVIVVDGQLSRGFRLPEAGLLVHAAGDVFEEERRRAQQRAGKRSAAATFLSDLRDLKVGDLVVHVDHGIGAVRRPQADQRGRRACRSSWSSAITATTSCSCPSNGSTSSRSTRGGTRPAARPARRHHLGEGEDHASRRPCATWPRSC